MTIGVNLGPSVPTGNTTEAAKAYFDYLYGTYYADMPLDRATNILWASPIKIFAWLAVLALTFYFFTVTFNRVHRGRDELYEAVSFAGSILERNGTVSAFTWITIGGLFATVLYLGIRYIILGYLY